MAGVTGSPASLGGMPTGVQGGQLAIGDPRGRAQRQPVVEDRGVRSGRVRDDERRAPQPSRQRIAGQRDGLRRQLLADPGPAAGLAEHRPPVRGVLGPGRPVQVDHQVGYGGRRQQRLVPPGGQRDRALGPVEALAEPGLKAGDVHIGEVPGGRPGPGRTRHVAGFRVQLDPPGRLVVPQPQPARGAQERADQVVLGEPVQLPVRGRGLAQRLAERGREVTQHADLGPARRGAPVSFSIFYTERTVGLPLRATVPHPRRVPPRPPRAPLHGPPPRSAPGGPRPGRRCRPKSPRRAGRWR